MNQMFAQLVLSTQQPSAFGLSVMKYFNSIFPKSATATADKINIHSSALNSRRFTKHFQETILFFTPAEKLKYQISHLGFTRKTHTETIYTIKHFSFSLSEFLAFLPRENTQAKVEGNRLVEHVNSLLIHFDQNPLYNVPAPSKLSELTDLILLSQCRLKSNLCPAMGRDYQNCCQKEFDKVGILEEVNRLVNLLTDNPAAISDEFAVTDSTQLLQAVSVRTSL